MHEQRNGALTLLLLVLVVWGVFAWLVAPLLALQPPPSLLFHKVLPVVAAAAIVISLFFSITSERTR